MSASTASAADVISILIWFVFPLSGCVPKKNQALYMEMHCRRNCDRDTMVIRVSAGEWFLIDERFPICEGSASSKIPESGEKSKSTMETLNMFSVDLQLS